MDHQTRREFLHRAALAGGVLSLAPWRTWAQDAPAATPAPAGETTAPVAMSIARWKGDPIAEPQVDAMARKLTEQAIAALGGMSRFVSRGATVWVKPNIGWNRRPEQAANTNPEVVATLVRLCVEAGAKKVKVGDHTCNDARESYKNSGIEDAARHAGAEIVFLDGSRFREVALGGEMLKTWELYPEIIESDLVINVPIVKHHGLSTATLCMKNYMGVIGGARNKWHQDIATCLCDITAYMKPRLCVLDAVRTLTAHGPVGGDLADVKRMDTIAAGTDIVALDALGAELLGHSAESLAMIRAAQQRGLGQSNYRTLPLREIAVS